MSELTDILILAYAFPPRGGVAVQRVLSWVKHFPSHGLRPIVLTVHPPRGATQIDHSLLAQIPEEAVVIRTTTFEPYRLYRALGGTRSQDDPSHRAALAGEGRGGVLTKLGSTVDARLLPDSKITWMPLAMQAAERIMTTFAPKAILATTPPASTFVIAGAIAERYRLPLVLDYRDPWTTGYYESGKSGERQAAERTMEQRLLSLASRVVTVSEDFAGRLDTVKESESDLNPIAVIENGFDPEEFVNLDPFVYDQPTLVHTGSLYLHRSPDPLFEASAMIREVSPDLWNSCEVRLIGNTDPRYVTDARALGLTNVTSEGFVDHRTALQYQLGADCLLLFTEGMMTAKVYEYLAAGRPILAIGEAPGLDQLLIDWNAGRCFARSDIAGIAGFLEEVLRERRETGRPRRVALTHDLRQFERGHLAGRYAELLKGVIAGS